MSVSMLDPYLGMAPALVRADALSRDERIIYGRLRSQLKNAEKVNNERIALYEGSNVVRHLNIAIPPGPLQDTKVVCGWGGSAIDILNERLGWDEWVSPGDMLGLDEVFEDNQLEDVIDKATVAALTWGVGFVIVGAGDPSNLEPDTLVTASSPSDCTILWDYRARRGIAALDRTVNDRGTVVAETLYLAREAIPGQPAQTIPLVREDNRMAVVDRYEHNMPFLPVTRIPNRGRTDREWGRSELTPAVRYYNDAAVRTLLGMEVNREFYTTPQRWLMGVDESAFEDEEGNRKSTWDAVMSKMLSMPRPRVENEETGVEEWGENPQVGQFTAAPPTPYIDQVRFYSQEFGREIGVPANYLGFITENPASADAIRAGEQRLTARTKRRMRGMTKPWREVARNIVMVRDGEATMQAALDTLRKITPNWADPSVTTPTAAVDEAIKLTAGDNPIVPATSRVLLERIGMSKQQILRIEEDRRKDRQRQRIQVGEQARQRAAVAPSGDTQPAALPGTPADVAR
jgi:hypothetical protein